jgi:FAD/FMN-containing dehydrogenase
MSLTTHQFDGRLVAKGDPRYEAARQDAVWNSRKPHRYPDLILVAGSDADVVAAVELAKHRGLRVSIRSGGHSWIGGGVRDGGLLVDLSELQEVTVDPEARLATVRPATRGPALDAALAGVGLFFPTGHAPTVGIGGFILGGGYGWNSRSYGPACLSIEAIDVVLADGRLIHADNTTLPELLWAARGSGPGFFGIVTRFYLRVYPRHTRLLRSAYVFPGELRDDVLRWSREAVPTLSPAVEMSMKVGFVDGVADQVATLTAAAFGTPEAGSELLDPVAGNPFRDRAIRKIEALPVELADMYEVADSLNPPGWRWSVDGIWCDAPAAEVVAAAAPIFDGLPSRKSFVLWMLWGGYPTREDACWSAQAPLYLSPNAGWQDPADDLVHEDWVHGSLARIGHLSRGTQFSDANPADRADLGLSAANAQRLEELRSKFDPDGVFRTYLTAAESTTSYGRRTLARGAEMSTAPAATTAPAQAWAHRDGGVCLGPLGPADWSPMALAARAQIAEAFYRFGIAHDEARIDVLATCFTADARFEVVDASTGSVEPFVTDHGRDQIVARLGATIAEQADQRRHLIGNVVVDGLTATTATALAYGAVTVAADGLLLGASVLYSADLTREDDGVWRFNRFRIGMDHYAGAKPRSGEGKPHDR